MRLAALIAAAAAVAVSTAAHAPAKEDPTRTVPCAESIDSVRFPYVGNREPRYRFRTVVGALSVPPAYVEQVVRQRDARWPYWSKYGVVVRANGPPVTIAVPRAWRSRVGIAWGNAGHGVLASVTLASCRAPAGTGNAYAGGFFLRAQPVCFPLVVRAAGRSATVWFGLGRRCR